MVTSFSLMPRMRAHDDAGIYGSKFQFAPQFFSAGRPDKSGNTLATGSCYLVNLRFQIPQRQEKTKRKLQFALSVASNPIGFNPAGIGRASSPLRADPSCIWLHDGAHGVTRPTSNCCERQNTAGKLCARLARSRAPLVLPA